MKLSELILIKDNVASIGGIIVGDTPDYAITLLEKLNMPITEGNGFIQAELSNLKDPLNTFARLKVEVNEKLVKRILLESRFSQFTKEVEDEFEDYIKMISSNDQWSLEYDTGWIDNDEGDYQYKGREYVEENKLFSIAYRVEVGYDENTRVGIELNILGGLYGDCGELMEEEVYNYVKLLRNQEVMGEEQVKEVPNDIDRYIEVAKSFVIELDKIKETKNPLDYSYLLDTLNCIRFDSLTAQLRIRFAQHNGYGDKSWFYYYDGRNDKYITEYNKRMEDVNAFIEYYMDEDIYNVFNHLKIELSEMGAWQAYLLAKATHFLPVYWHGGYSRRSLIFSKDDINKLPAYTIKRINNLVIPGNQDVSPSITIEGDTATVRCCYWNDWMGLVRETVKIDILDNKAYFLETPTTEVLYKFVCGIRY